MIAVQGAAKLRRVIVDLIDGENWSLMSADVKGSLRGPAGEERAGHQKRRRPVLHAARDIFWLKDDSLANSDNLPPPEAIAQEIVEDLEAALEQFRLIAGDLSGDTAEPA